MAQILKEEVRERILRAATDQLLQYGEAATMRQIAHAAGLTVGNLYRYYEGKEELVSAIIQPLVSGMDQVLRASTNEALVLGQAELPPMPDVSQLDRLMEEKFYPLMRQVLIQTAALCRLYPMQAAILMRMDSAGNKLIDWFHQIVDQALLLLVQANDGDVQGIACLADAECQSFCRGISVLLQSCGEMSEKGAEMLIENYLYIHVQGVAALLRREVSLGAIQLREEQGHAADETGRN